MYDLLCWVKIEDGNLINHDNIGEDIVVPLEDIVKIAISTNDEGPMGTDVWWDIYTKNMHTCYPGGAEGETEALEYFQTLEGFDNDAVIAAMTCTHDKQFVCWERK